MTREQVKAAVLSGTPVYVGNTAYQVIQDSLGQWLIHCTLNGYCIGLTWQDGTTLNADESEFYTEGDQP